MDMKKPFDELKIGLFNEDLQDIIILLLDFFSHETDLVVALYGPDGKEVWCACEERFAPLCGFLKAVPTLWAQCCKNHSERAISNAPLVSGSYLSVCHFGLWNISYPLFFDNMYCGSLLTGQKRISDEGKEKITNQIFHTKVQELKELGLISNKDATTMTNCFNAVDKVSDIESLSLKQFALIEEKLIGLISNLVARVRKITLLRHEIHQPNMAVLGTLTKVIDRLRDIGKKINADSPVAVEFASIIRSLTYTKSASRLFSVIIENICTSLSGDELVLSLSRHNILQSINEAKNIFETYAMEKEVVIKPIEKKIVDAYILEFDEGLIMRALINIYNNAVKYSYFGGTDSSMRTIVTKVWSMEKYFRISVSNYGIGILKEELAKVWEEGFRGILASDRHRIGSGLGLHQVKQIIEAHRGAVQIVSDPVSDDYISGPYLTTLIIDLPYSFKNGGQS